MLLCTLSLVAIFYPFYYSAAILCDAHALLLFENFEQCDLRRAVAGRDRAACPRVTILVTSRERLPLTAEEVFHVDPLCASGPELFSRRARALYSGFEHTPARRRALRAARRAAAGDRARGRVDALVRCGVDRLSLDLLAAALRRHPRPPAAPAHAPRHDRLERLPPPAAPSASRSPRSRSSAAAPHSTPPAGSSAMSSTRSWPRSSCAAATGGAYAHYAARVRRARRGVIHAVATPTGASSSRAPIASSC